MMNLTILKTGYKASSAPYFLNPNLSTIRKIQPEKNIMAFVNEYLSKENIAKHRLAAIDKNYFVGAASSGSRTIDRERNIYLLNVWNDREQFKGESGWTFFWQGEWIYLELKLLELSDQPDGSRCVHWKLLTLESPTHLKDQRIEILADLKDALVARKEGSVCATATNFSVTLDI